MRTYMCVTSKLMCKYAPSLAIAHNSKFIPDRYFRALVGYGLRECCLIVFTVHYSFFVCYPTYALDFCLQRVSERHYLWFLIIISFFVTCSVISEFINLALLDGGRGSCNPLMHTVLRSFVLGLPLPTPFPHIS